MTPSPRTTRRRALPAAAATALLAVVLAAWCGLALAHSEPTPPPQPPQPPQRTAEVRTSRILPPRWSWLHWWEANRERYLVSPSQDAAMQPTDPAQLDALREEAARELAAAIEGGGREAVGVEAALALGKMRHEPALPLLKQMAAKAERDTARRAALLGMGLLGSDAAEQELGQFSSTRVDERVAAIVAIGLLPDISDETLRRLRGVLNTTDPQKKTTESQAIATAVCWTLRQHRKDDNLEYFRGLVRSNGSAWIASEALLGLGGTRDHAAQRLLEDALFGTATDRIAAYEYLEKMAREKQQFAAGPGGGPGLMPGARGQRPQRSAADEEKQYQGAYEDYVKRHQEWWKNSPNPPKLQGKQAKPGPEFLELGPEEISMAWLRASAAIGLGQLDAPRAGEALLRFIQDDKSIKDEYQYNIMPMGFAIMALASYPTEASRDRFIALLGKQDGKAKLVLDVQTDSPLRGFAALALGLYARPHETEQGPADRPRFDWALTTLAERLQDEREEEEVRTACAVALGLAQRTAVLPVLHQLSNKLAQRNRRADFPVLGFLMLGRALAGDRSVVEPAAKFLLDRADDTSPSGILSRRAAVLALGVTRSSTAIPVLTQAWHLNHYVNREVILALRLVGAGSAAAPVMERLRNPKNDTERAYMANALGELLAHEQPTAMSRLIAGSNYTVRNEQLLPLQAMANGFLFDYLIASFGEAW